MAESVQHRGFQGVAADVQPIGARALGAGGPAAEQVLGDHGVAAAAARAAHEAGEQVLGPAALGQLVQRHLARLHPQRGLTRPHRGPEIVAHDPELGDVLDDPLRFGIGARNPLARIRVLQEALPVPYKPADVEFVVQYAIATLEVAVDGARAPGASLWAGHALLVQRQGDRARGTAGGVVPKDAPHHLGFGRVDAPLSGDPLSVGSQAADDVVAEAEAAARLALLHAAALSAPGLVGQILEEEGIHRALQADVQVGDVALGQSDDAHAGERHALEQTGDVLLVAAQPIHGLGQHDLEAAPPGVLDQLLDARAKKGSAGDGTVGIAVDDRPALSLGVQSAEPELILYRRIPLAVGRIAGVQGGSKHGLNSAVQITRLLALTLMVIPRGLTGQQSDESRQLGRLRGLV